ncbi:MAG: hypothetical protein JOZ43_03165 [Acidobacteriales bacterium]|nr:hypothetical protein [Terriglobales bacterium]
MTAQYKMLPTIYRLLLVLTAGLVVAVSQEPSADAPLSVDQIVARLVSKNEARSKALTGYSSIRTYHLECHCISPKKADMTVRARYSAQRRTKDFEVVSESGSGTVRSKVFRKLLEAEQEALQLDNERRLAITPENYSIRLLSYEKTQTGDAYVLEVLPRGKSKFLFRGRIWVDGTDFAITRAEGEPAVNPSWWTKKTEVVRTYEKVGEFWLPQNNNSVTQLKLLGTAMLEITYGSYQLAAADSDGSSPSGR